MNSIKIAAAICLIFALGAAAGSLQFPPPPAARVVHFHGRFDAVKFCEGDDGELISQAGKLGIECADRRRTLISIDGGEVNISHWNLSGTWWAKTAVAVAK